MRDELSCVGGKGQIEAQRMLLFGASGVISDGDKQWVHSRARPFLADGTLKDVA